MFCSMILLPPLYLRMLIRATTTLANEALPLAMAITSPVVMRFDFCLVGTTISVPGCMSLELRLLIFSTAPFM